MERYLPTGNERVSLPTLRESDGGVESVSFLLMAQKGLVELRGTDERPFMAPFVEEVGPDGRAKALPLADLSWSRQGHWIPRLEAKAGDAALDCVYLTPVGERGFALRLTLQSDRAQRLRFGLKGLWAGAWHCINEEKEIQGSRHCYPSTWNHSLIFDFRWGFPLFAFAPMADREVASSFEDSPRGTGWALSLEVDLTPGQAQTVTFYWGLGFEEVAAATSAKEMLRRGWDWELERTLAYLKERAFPMPTPALTRIYNTNLFFCLFYSTGITLDTEERICATSRSSRYYVSAAYWDRDTLLWAFPALLEADRPLAREILRYVFTRQGRNFGVHSRYIDGTVLEPGFELDELVAPAIALCSYAEVSGDRSLLADPAVRAGIDAILAGLDEVKHPEVDLYETFLQPTDDERVHPYITYDNVLVWLALSRLAALDPAAYGPLGEKARKVREAVYAHCVFQDEAGRPYFGWSVDLAGRHDVYDEPPGSQQLYPYYGFCSPEDEVWRNTVAMIRSPRYAYSFAGQPIAEIGCPHAPYPWVLSLCNSLLCGHAEQAWQELEQLEMDNGIACESVDSVTGACTTGAAFATCAGFLCHSMRTAAKEATPCERI